MPIAAMTPFTLLGQKPPPAPISIGRAIFPVMRPSGVIATRAVLAPPAIPARNAALIVDPAAIRALPPSSFIPSQNIPGYQGGGPPPAPTGQGGQIAPGFTPGRGLEVPVQVGGAVVTVPPSVAAQVAANDPTASAAVAQAAGAPPGTGATPYGVEAPTSGDVWGPRLFGLGILAGAAALVFIGGRYVK